MRQPWLRVCVGDVADCGRSLVMTSQVLRNCDESSGLVAKTLANYMWLNWVIVFLASLYMVTIVKGISRGFRLYVRASRFPFLALHFLKSNLVLFSSASVCARRSIWSDGCSWRPPR